MVNEASAQPLLTLEPADGLTATGGEVWSASVRRCPVCRAKVLVKLPGEIVIRNAIFRVDPATERVSARCSRCKAWVEMPLRFIG